MKVRFSAKARADLVEIGDYLKAEGGVAASAFVEELIEKCSSLTDAPLRFALLPRFEHLGIRRRPVGSYVVLYRVDQIVEIVRVLHAARNYPLLLK